MKDATLEKAVVAKTSMEDIFYKGDYMRFSCSLSGKDRLDKATLHIHSKADDLDYREDCVQFFHCEEKVLLAPLFEFAFKLFDL